MANTRFNLILQDIPFVEPAQIFSLFEQEKYSFFLDSGMNRYGLGRYSFIGFWPFMVFKTKGSKIKIFDSKGEKGFTADPFETLRQLTNRYRLKSIPNLPSFLGGAVGYFSYEMRHLLEDLPGDAIDDLQIPDCIFCFYDLIIIFDHLQQKAYLCSSGFPESGKLRQSRAKNRIKEALSRLSGFFRKQQALNKLRDSEIALKPPGVSLLPSGVPSPPPGGPDLSGERGLSAGSGLGYLIQQGGKEQPDIVSNFTRQEYLKAVEQAKEYIGAGDIYQVNLSQRLTSGLFIPPFELYKRLRTINPAPFAGFLNLGELIIAGASPERFLHVEGNKVETRPIKGTRPRGKNRSQDLRLKAELKGSEKDKAELIMIIDLLRNDLGRVCQYGSVQVKELIKLETHPTVFHTVSVICGQLNSGSDRFDLLRACFPGGSITGAPKIRAMEIINELEPTKRHIYTGSSGYLSFTGSMDLNILIRTFLIKGNKAYFQIGGGIVADSEPEAEYRETLDKGRALIEVLKY